MGGLATPLLSSIATHTSLQVALSSLLAIPIATLPLLYRLKDPLWQDGPPQLPKEIP